MVNTVNNQPAAASLQLTDDFLIWQSAQSPPTRKLPVSGLSTYYLPLTGGTVTGNLTLSAGNVAVTGTGAFSGVLTASAGLSGTQVVNFNQFAVTGTNPLSQILPGGLIIKSGSTVVTLSVAGGGTIAFAVAFPSSTVSAVVSNGDASGGGTSVAPVLQGAATRTGFTFTFPGAGAATVRLNWIALGF